MPVSTYLQISPILDQTVKLHPKTILDVGCGLGIYGALSRVYLEGDNIYDRENLAWNKKENWKIKIDCIEGFDRYITDLHRFVYNEIFISDAKKILHDFKDRSYDLVLAVDILEHLRKEEGALFIKELARIGKNVIVATPAEFIKQVVPENPLEDHLSFWNKEELQAFGFTVIENRHALIGIFNTPRPEEQITGTLSSNAAVRLYQAGDEHGIIRLFKEIFGREMTLEEWRWKYTGKGNEKVYSSVAVNEAGEIVAHYGGMPQRMVFKGGGISGISIGDVMVHTRYRMLKLFKKVTALLPAETVKEGFVLGYGFPNERAMALPEKLGLYEKIEDVSEASKDAQFTNNLGRFIYKFSPLSYDDSRIDALWKSVEREFTLAVIRDREYLAWRYQRHPFYKYELWGLKNRWGNKLSALAVLRRDGERMLIIDFVCREDILSALFQKIENYSYISGVKTIALWFPEYLRQRMEDMGFSIKPTGTCIPRTTHEGWLKRGDIKGKFFYTMGDTDFL